MHVVRECKSRHGMRKDPKQGSVQYGVLWVMFTRSCVFLPNLLCMTRKTKARARQRLPTAMYAMPRNGLRPPSHEVLDRIMRLLPLNAVTG